MGLKVKGGGNWETGAEMELQVESHLLTASHFGFVVACEIRNVEELPDDESPPMVAFDVFMEDGDEDVDQVARKVLSAASDELDKLAERISAVRRALDKAENER